MARSFVSVLIDTYNHERFIEQAMVSVLQQDFPEAEREIIVVDDGSTDRTPEIVKKFEPRVRLLRKENGGQASGNCRPWLARWPVILRLAWWDTGLPRCFPTAVNTPSCFAKFPGFGSIPRRGPVCFD